MATVATAPIAVAQVPLPCQLPEPTALPERTAVELRPYVYATPSRTIVETQVPARWTYRSSLSRAAERRRATVLSEIPRIIAISRLVRPSWYEIGRASCRERV